MTDETDENNEFASSDEEDTRSIADIIFEEAVDTPEATGKILPKDAVMALKTEIVRRGHGYALPKTVLDKLFDFKPDEAKNRAYTYSRKLNRQYPPSDKKLVWRVGVNGSKFYTIGMVDKTTTPLKPSRK